MSKKIFLQKTYADAVKGFPEWEIGPGESVIRPESTGFPYHRVSSSPTRSPKASSLSPSSRPEKSLSSKESPKPPKTKTPNKEFRLSLPVSPVMSSASVTPTNSPKLARVMPTRSSPRLNPDKHTKNVSSTSAPSTYSDFGEELSSTASESSSSSPLSKAEEIMPFETESPESLPSLVRSRKRNVTSNLNCIAGNSAQSPYFISNTSEDGTCDSPLKKQKCSPVRRKLFTPNTDQSLSDEEISADITETEEQPFSKFYDNDPLLPIYKSLPTGIKTKDAISLLLQKLKPEVLSKNIPNEINKNVSFVYSINNIGHWKNALCDGMGRWNQSGTETIFVNVGNSINDISFIQKKQLTDSSVKVIRRKYSNSSFSKLHRILITLENPTNNQTLDQIFVQYYFEGEEKTVVVAPHGNSKGTNKFQRTNETTKRRILELCENTKPKDVFHTIIEEQGGLNEVKSGSCIAKDRQQIRNFKRQIVTSSDPVVECSDLAKKQEKKEDRFLREVRSAPEFTMFMSTDRQLNDIEKFCTDENGLSVLGIDTTFNIGKYYVTITTYRHLMLTNLFGVEPVMIGPILLHQRKSFDSYFKLSSSILQNCQNLRNLKVFGTDGDVSLSTAFQVCFADSAHLLCDVHMVDNIDRKLKTLNITGKIAKQYLRDIFGSVKDKIKTKGLVDCMSETEIDECMDSLVEEWKIRHEAGEAFLQYFLENKLDLLKNCMSAEIRSKCGLGFPPKPYTQNGNECINSVLKTDIGDKTKKLDPYDFVKIAEKTVRRKENEIKLSLIGKGEYNLKPSYQHLAVEENQYWRKTAQQREAVFKRMQNEPLKMNNAGQQEKEIPYLMQTVQKEAENIKSVPKRILEDMFREAGELTHKPNNIVPLPGSEEGNKYLIVNKEKPTEPYSVIYVRSSGLVSCDKKCPRWCGFKICEHSIALASYLEVLQTYIIKYEKRQNKIGTCNLTSIVNTNMPTHRGKKATTATQRRKGKASKTSKEIISYNEPNAAMKPTPDTTIAQQQPFHLTFMAGLIKKCYGCSQEFQYKHRSPPNDLVLKRFDYRTYTSPRSKVKKQSQTLQNTYFHLNKDCVRRVWFGYPSNRLNLKKIKDNRNI